MSRRWFPSGGRRGPRNDEERILPLINIVFLLLIVFMLAGQLNASDPFRIEPPFSISEGQAKERGMTILMDASGRLALDGAVIEAAALKEEVAARVAGGSIGEVRLKADGEVDAAKVVALLELLRDAGVETLQLLAASGTR